MKEKHIKEHPTKEWEISIIEFSENGERYYKVTRKLKNQQIQETKVFRILKEAKEQFNEWLGS